MKLEKKTTARPEAMELNTMIHPGGRIPDHFTNDLCRDTGHRHMRRHVIENDTTRADSGVLPDFHIAEDFGPGANEDPMADLRMPDAFCLPGSPKGHLVQDGNVILDHGGFTKENAGGVVKKDTGPNLCGRGNVHSEDL